MELFFPSAKVMVLLMVMLMDVMMMLYLMVHEHTVIYRFDGYQFPNLVICFPVVFDPRRSDAMAMLLTTWVMVSDTYIYMCHGSERSRQSRATYNTSL